VPEDVFQFLCISFYNIKASASHVSKAAHISNFRAHLFRQVATQNIPKRTDGVSRLVHGDLESDIVFLSSEQTSLNHFFFVMAREQRQRLAKRLFHVTFMKCYQHLSCFLK